MAKVTINNYADVTKQLDAFVKANSLTPGLAPHQSFWSSLSYEQFTTGTVPNLGVPILVKGDSASSNIIQVLRGGSHNKSGFPDMPAPNPPYNGNTPTQNAIIDALAGWIDNNCPN